MLRPSQDLNWLDLNRWQEYVAGHSNSSVFHHKYWLTLLQEQYGLRVVIPAIINRGHIEVAIPFLQTINLRGKKRLASLPFTDCLPFLSPYDEAVETLCQLVQGDLAGQYDSIIIRGDKPVSGLENSSHFVRHELPTNMDLAEIEQSFASAIRRNLRKGQRHQLVFENRTDEAAIGIFYRMHVLTRRKLGVPVQSKRYFQRLHESLIRSGLGSVAIVHKENVPIAASVLLSFNGRMTYKYGASDPSALEFRPNECLLYNSIRIAVESGCRFFDFGVSDRSQEGLRRFKSKWGAVESDVFYSYIDGKPVENGGPSPVARMAGEIIKRSPTLVCRLLGKALYRYSQ